MVGEYLFLVDYIYILDWLIGLVVECSPIAWETGVQSQVETYQRLKKWYLIPPCLTLSIIRYVLRVKGSNPGKGVVPSPAPWCSSYWKGSFWVALDYGHQLYYIYIYIYIYLEKSKVLQYFIWDTILQVFARVMMMMNHTRLWDVKLTLYSLSSTCWIGLYSLKHSWGIHIFWPTWPIRSSSFLQPKQNLSGYCNVSNCIFTFHTTNIFWLLLQCYISVQTCKA